MKKKINMIAVLLAVACLNLGCAKQMRRAIDPIIPQFTSVFAPQAAKKQTMGPILQFILSIFGNPPGKS